MDACLKKPPQFSHHLHVSLYSVLISTLNIVYLAEMSACNYGKVFGFVWFCVLSYITVFPTLWVFLTNRNSSRAQGEILLKFI